MSHDDLKSSAHVWGDGSGVGGPQGVSEGEGESDARTEATSTPTEAPPAYSTAATNHPSTSQPRTPPNPLSQLAALATVPWSQYQLPSATLSPDRTVQTTTHPPYQTRSESLAALLIQQAALPPKPSLVIKGTHKTPSGETKTDFEITLSLLPLLALDTPHPSRLRLQPPPSTITSPATSVSGSKLFKSSPPASPPTPLQAWTRHFTVTDKSEHRSLTLTRTIADLESVTGALEGRARNLLAALKYRGKLDVSFPVEHRDVVVLKRPGNWLVGLLRIYPERRFEVAQAVWELAGVEGEDGSGSGASSPAAVVAERWWRVWEGPVRNAVLARTRGRVGVEEWISWSMGAVEAERRVEWGLDGGYESSL